MSHLILWRFEVPAERRADFESAYGPDGPWAALFGLVDGYLGTELVHVEPPGTYLTIDRWTTASAFERFRRSHRAAYERLDRALDAMSTTEQFLGAGDTEERGSALAE